MTQGPITILVVEDEAQVRSLLNAMLEDAGFEVIVAEEARAHSINFGNGVAIWRY